MTNKNLKVNNLIQTRIAPSPTGFLHIGLARTALFNYLFAKKNQGNFILRIEDTDLERSDSKFEKDIIEGLKWLGLEWTKGPDKTENAGLFRQSERLPIYAEYIKKLLKEGRAYYCFCSKEELEAHQQYLISIGQPSKYSEKCRNLPPKTVKQYLAEGKSHIIRFKIPHAKRKIKFHDLIRGTIEFDANLIGDFAIAKDLATPLYNLAVVIDDFEMKISHVIRGEDHIPNTPKQILIQEALNFPQPKYAHLPLILGPDKTKLSKRHGATAISQYKKMGYLPEAINNFMAFLGWNPGTKREIFSLGSLVKEFSLNKVQKSGAIFNIKKLDYLNGYYIRRKPLDKLTELCIPYLIENNLITPQPEPQKTSSKIEFLGIMGIEFLETFIINETKEKISINLLKKVIKLYQERLKKLSEIPSLIDFFFKDKLKYNKDLLRWKQASDKEVIQALDKVQKLLYKIKSGEWNREEIEKILLSEAEKFGKKIDREGERGYLLWPLRVALTGKEASAGPFEIAEILGKEKSLKRLKEARELMQG